MTTLRGYRVLVVEDNFHLAETLSDLLDECGCVTVGPAARVSDALSLCGNDLDGALLDISLGRETSFAIADRLTEQGVPFLFLSGYENSIIPARFGNIPNLGTPYDRDKLLEVAERRFARPGRAAGR